MNVHAILESSTARQEQATVHAFLRVTGEGQCFLSDAELDDCGKKLVIQDARLYEKLLDAVPCLVGGSYLYDDRAVVEGDLGYDGETVVFASVKKVTIDRNGKRFEIALDD
ncbi:MAG: hypothetical protein KatS3mg105_4692 [Gemmatales bacterium]|nr:MAG: hypothetical protein KatS3mg105_4692 [Gemmatales bacterium]